MRVRSSALAKLTRPKPYDAVERPRLFELLDKAARRPIVWVCAPPGAGKTTLVASYLEARRLRHLWYQVDVGDADPATFVHFMRIAAAQVVRRNTALPFFPPEPQQDLARFARSFFRDLFSSLPRPCAIVLDNFQEARAASEHRAALAQALEEIPEGITLFVVSRAEPPPEFARLVASRRIGRVDESALRCTPGEAAAILRGEELDERLVQRILRQSDGWVAALILLREHLHGDRASPEEALGDGKEAIFQYFAGEIFNRARPENQRMLMLTSLPPTVTPSEAIALTGSEEAPRLLEYLYRRHLFIDRRLGTHTTYQYHALFREYLGEEIRRRMLPELRHAAIVRAAALSAERGEAVAALELYRKAGEWDAMRALIRIHALEWAREGRAQVVSDWIEALPAELRSSDPWLEYWFGRAWIFLQPERGRPALERAFAAFRTDGDLRGQALAASTIATGHYYEWADFRPLDRWLGEFDRILSEAQSMPLDPESELRTRAAQLIALLFRRPEKEALQRCAARLDALLDQEVDPNVRVMAASILMNTYNWTNESSKAGGLVARMGPVLMGGAVGPLMQLWWRTHLSFWHYLAGRYEQAHSVSQEAREVAERYGLQVYMFEIEHGRASALITKGALAEAKSVIDAMAPRLISGRRMDWAYLHHLRSALAQRQGKFASAVQEAEVAVGLGRELGLPVKQLPQFLMRLAHSRGAAGDRTGCTQAVEEAIALSSGAERAGFERQRDLLHIDDDIDAGRTEQAARRLAAVLADYRRNGRFVFLRNRPELAARLAGFALEHDVEPEFVHELIARNKLEPPAGASSKWPFRLRVHVLGRFELMRDGQAIRAIGKAQQRPLDLLKLLVALGGRDVDSQQVMAALWPDADGAAAQTAFDAALFRLRKLLDVDQAIILAGGKLTLSAALVWTDVRALQAAVESAQRAGLSDAELSAAAARLIDAYPGPLLGDEEPVWTAKPRDALRSRFTRSLLRLGEKLERRGDWSGAIDLYRRGLEADNLAESFHRGLMRSLAAYGQQAEALAAYRRCRELLSIVLGVKPAADTEHLHRRIRDGQFTHA